MHRLLTDSPVQVVLDRIAIQSAEQASSALTKWFGRTVRIHSEGFAHLSLAEATTAIAGGEAPVVAIHMAMEGALEGHVLLAFPEDVACRLVSILMGEEIAQPENLGEMGESAVCETGNIVGSTFINSLATHLGVRARPSAPQYRYDLGAALIAPLVAEQVREHANVFFVEATFEIDGESLDWWLYVLPTPECLQVMLALLH